jgi:hypothetical protein
MMKNENQIRNLVKKLRSGEFNDRDRKTDANDRASYLIDHDPPDGWNYFESDTTWSEKWIISMSLGPWEEKQTQDVMGKVLDALNKRPLTKLHKNERLPFPKLQGDWQWEWTIYLSEYLREIDWSDSEFFTMLKNIDGGGLAARAALRAICEAWGTSKTIDYFIREALDLEIIPIDRHVKRMLVNFGLSNLKQEELIALCKAIGVKPQRLARALYKAYSPPNLG